MKLYPAMIDLNGKKVVVIGGGNVAARKVQDLIECGANISIISPALHKETQKLIEQYSIHYIDREHQSGDLQGAFLVIAATNDHTVNGAIAHEAQLLNILINCVDDPDNCNFYVPSFFRKGELLVAVSTSGSAPALAARLRRKIEEDIDSDFEVLLVMISKVRTILKENSAFFHLDQPAREKLLNTILDNSDHIQALKDIDNEPDAISYLLDIIKSTES